MIFTQVVLAAVLGLAHALPATPAPSGGKKAKEVDYLATFDDLHNAVSAVTPILQDVGPYDGLDYTSLILTTRPQGLSLVGVNPHSNPNIVAFGLVDTTLTGTPSIKAAYDDSITKSFSLKSFYFACVTNAGNSIADPPSSCDLTFKGFKDGEEVASQDYSFEPTGKLSSDMAKVEVDDSFEDVDEVTFELDGTLAAVTAGLLDDLEYTVFLK